VINVVPGFGPTAGAALASHMDVDMASNYRQISSRAASTTTLPGTRLRTCSFVEYVCLSDARRAFPCTMHVCFR
jgi:hypothetical protein